MRPHTHARTHFHMYAYACAHSRPCLLRIMPPLHVGVPCRLQVLGRAGAGAEAAAGIQGTLRGRAQRRRRRCRRRDSAAGQPGGLQPPGVPGRRVLPRSAASPRQGQQRLCTWRVVVHCCPSAGCPSAQHLLLPGPVTPTSPTALNQHPHQPPTSGGTRCAADEDGRGQGRLHSHPGTHGADVRRPAGRARRRRSRGRHQQLQPAEVGLRACWLTHGRAVSSKCGRGRPPAIVHQCRPGVHTAARQGDTQGRAGLHDSMGPTPAMAPC